MNAALTMTAEDEPRLYSRGYRDNVVSDQVSPQQQRVHEILVRWGAWGRRRAASSSLASIERLYTKGDSPASTAPLTGDPLIMATERAVLGLPILHRRWLYMVYVARWTSHTACKALRLHRDSYGEFSYSARAMVANRLRQQGF